jgi:4-diphosphocytidyl-2-C-methyl-D-erythritol kinase
VTDALREEAPAKLNLCLFLGPRRDSDGRHELVTVFQPLTLADHVALEPAPFGAQADAVACPGVPGPPEDNLAAAALRAFRERTGWAGPPVRLRIDKRIPVAAGMAGGSADAGAALRLLAGVNGLALDDPRLAAAAVAVGADVPVCLDPRPRIMRGLGDLLSPPLKLPRLAAVFANPGVPLPTRDVFARFSADAGSKKYIVTVPESHDAMLGFLVEHGNDLTQSAIACAPVVAEVMIALRALPAVRLVRMAGSGPTCFALFASQGEANAAAERLQAENRNWWVCATPIG